MRQTTWRLVPNRRDVLIWQCLEHPELYYFSSRQMFWSPGQNRHPVWSARR